MASGIIRVDRNFWNIRGSFKVGGVIDVGTQSSLVKCKSGSFVLLDSCDLGDEAREQIGRLTDGGKLIRAIINLHPFHTVSVPAVHRLYPRAALYGTSRHHDRFPDLPWEPVRSEDGEMQALFGEDLEFSVPRGVDFISANENIHFSSVLAFHPGSKTIHVDDTLMFVPMPGVLGYLGLRDTLGFHPSLPLALQRHPGAADAFEDWARELAGNWSRAKNLCAAHTAPLLGRENEGRSIEERILRALARVKWVLAAHRLRYGKL